MDLITLSPKPPKSAAFYPISRPSKTLQQNHYGRRSLGEVAMLRYKTLIGCSLHARTLPRQKTEAKVACNVINIMTGLGMPVSRRAT